MLFHLGALTWLSLFAHYAKLQMDSIDFSGTSDQDECSIQCNLNFFPYCATNGVTYINECFYMRARCLDPKIQLQKMPGIPCGLLGSMDATKYTGCEKGCAPVEFPYCGTNGVTYINRCALDIATCEDANVQLARLPGLACGSETNFSISSSECEGLCSEHYIPYCGSDGKTYINYCEFRKSRCRNPTLSIVGFPGLPCESQIYDEKVIIQQTRKIECLRKNKCSSILIPICGSDGVTYRNPCEFKRARCRDPSLRRANILLPCGSKISDGVENIIDKMPNATSTDTHRSCWFKCTKVWEYPLCGSDGITYSSYCEMRNALCLDPDLRLVKVPGVKCSSDFQFTNPIEIDKCRDDCPFGKTLSYICGSDNKTYFSYCEFSNEMCRNPELYLAKPMGFPCREEDRNKDLESVAKEYQTMDEVYFGITNFKSNAFEEKIEESRMTKNSVIVINNANLQQNDIRNEMEKNSDLLFDNKIYNSNNYNHIETNNTLHKNITNMLGYEVHMLNHGLETTNCEFDCSNSPRMAHCGSNMLTYPSGCTFHRDQCRNPKLQLVAEPGIPCSELGNFKITPEKMQECLRDCTHSQKVYHCLNTGETIYSYCEFLYLQCLIPGYRLIGHAGIPCDDISEYRYYKKSSNDESSIDDSNASDFNVGGGDYYENQERVFQKKIREMLNEIPSYEYTGLERIHHNY
ncbi:Kazal-type serine protease inhibitor domain protein [Cryptosporidium meleagridis]|uniref:Kazal-type serine protease inhibitor domain protein n=1 Tax=Cryptosporidium meleagridis TaxID=93969 RepID=A0A2P4YZG4_9CRYT|nr:Kazal-type serine protease inhibitor domain protein [Cryptosporidium meleagridis]